MWFSQNLLLPCFIARLGVSCDAGIYKRQIEPLARKITGLQSGVNWALGSFLSITQRKRLISLFFRDFWGELFSRLLSE